MAHDIAPTSQHAWLRRGVLILAASIAVVIPFRGLFRGALIGDAFDARWTSTLYEHWFLVLTGQRGLRETGIFFPLDNTLGFSDAFLAPGITHSVLRVVGLDPIPSWIVTNLIWQGVFVAGLTVLSVLIFHSTVIQVTFVLVAGSGYTWVAQLEHPQTLMYGLLVWIVNLIILGLRTSPRQRNYAWALIPALVGILAMSAWYPFFFLVLLTPISLGAIALMLPWSVIRQRLAHSWQSLPRGWTVMSTTLFLVLMSAWVWIYLPVAGKVRRTWDDYLMHAPTFVDFLGANHLGGGVWGMLYDRIEWLYRSASPNLEARLGFTPVLLLSFGLVLVASLAILSRRRSHLARVELIIGLIVLSAWVLIAIDARGFSLFLGAWALPGGDAIRAPMRINIILSVAALAGVLLAVQSLIARIGEKGRMHPFVVASVAALFGVVLFTEQIRLDTARWNWSDADETELLRASTVVTNAGCTAFRIVRDLENTVSPDDTPVLESLVATRSGIPTTGGYSGGVPEGFRPVTERICVLEWPAATLVK